VIFDVSGYGLGGTVIREVIKIFTDCFIHRLNRLFFVNADWHMDDLCADQQNLEPLIAHQTVICTQDCSQLQLYISKDCLEQKYGGSLENIEKFFPPDMSHAEEKFIPVAVQSKLRRTSLH
jgi:hypothetical protein